MKYKKSIKALQEVDIKSQISNFLDRNKNTGYTYSGILNELFGIEKAKLEGNWSQELINKYNVVRRALNQLHTTDFTFIHKKTEGRTNFFWYKSKRTIKHKYI